MHIFESFFIIDNFFYNHFLNFLKIIFFVFISLFNNNNLFNHKNTIELDNELKYNWYEKNQEYENYEGIKIYCLYYPEYSFYKSINVNSNNTLKLFSNINNSNSFENQAIINNKELNISIKYQIQLAKSHGITGFGIIYYYDVIYHIFKELIEEIANLSFPFFLIIKKYYKGFNKHNNILLSEEYNSHKDLYENYEYIKYIKEFMKSKYYININKKPLLGIWQPVNNTFILNIRKLIKEMGNKEVYIIGITEKNEHSNSFTYCDGFSEFKEFPSKSLFINNSFKNVYYYNYYYDFIRNKNFSEYEIHNLIVLKGSSPEKFYLISKYIIDLIRKKKKNNFLLVNAWNNFEDNYFIEYDEKCGYSYLNSFSKAILNINFTEHNYNLSYNVDFGKCKIAVQAHIFYESLISELINKINNIPIKFDLYISVISNEIKEKIINYINNTQSKLNHLEINIYENRGRDVLPFLRQLKDKFKNYKYICHVHTKRSLSNPYIGFLWRNYLYNNLLGDANIISEILMNFDKPNKIGIIFPETYYLIFNDANVLNTKTKKYTNLILKKIFPGNEIGNLKAFPAGNMFWSRTQAIFQIFIYDFYKYFSKEKDQKNDTIMHGIERIWLYLVKMNGFSYKIIFKKF